MMKANILLYIVDDDDIYNFTVKKMMERCIVDYEIEVETYLDGESALKGLLSSIKMDRYPKIIFLDLDMPIMDGWEFLKATEKLENNAMPAIFISSSTINPDEIARAESHPLVEGFISKPISKERLHEVCISLRK